MTTVAVRPLPGMEFEEHEASPQLAEWMVGVTDGAPVVVILNGYTKSRLGTPVPLVVAGAVFDGRVYGEEAEVGVALLIAHHVGLAKLPESGADLGVVELVDD